MGGEQPPMQPRRLPAVLPLVPCLALGLALAGPGSLALAHDGLPPEPHDLWTAWSRDPLVWLALTAVGTLYLRGARSLWARAGAGHGLRRWQALAYVGGIATLALALLSPLDALGSALLSAHMVQHLLLIAVAAPLLVLGQPTITLLWALPERRRRQLGRWWHRAPGLRSIWALLCLPLVAWLLHSAALWAWHAPPLYQAALDAPMLHGAEHLSFLGTALLFWWTVLAPGRAGAPTIESRRAAYGLGALSIFALTLQSGLLGALMTFAPSPWYPAYAGRTAPWGLAPLEDQQLAGLLMWVPGGMIYAAVALGLLAIWIRPRTA
jgi:putative membrane protein